MNQNNSRDKFDEIILDFNKKFYYEHQEKGLTRLRDDVVGWLRTTLHQELQKARDELAAEIIKDVNTMWVDELSRKEREDGATAIGYSRVVAYLSNKNQSELDQPNHRD